MLTDPSATDDQRNDRIQELRARYLTDMRTARKARLPQDVDEPGDMQSSTERSWKERLLEQLMRMPPDAFERLAKRLLREADFDSVNVTRQSGDGGIDGLGVYMLGLVSFRSSSSASDTASVSAQALSATFVARWQAGATKAF